MSATITFVTDDLEGWAYEVDDPYADIAATNRQYCQLMAAEIERQYPELTAEIQMQPTSGVTYSLSGVPADDPLWDVEWSQVWQDAQHDVFPGGDPTPCIVPQSAD